MIYSMVLLEKTDLSFVEVKIVISYLWFQSKEFFQFLCHFYGRLFYFFGINDGNFWFFKIMIPIA